MSKSSLPALLPTAEVATRLRLSVRHINRLAQTGQLTPATKVPGIRGAYLFTEDEVARFEQERADQVPA